MSDRRLDGAALRDWAHAGVGHLITHTDEINRLNVFPVADADTGTNMLFTMRSACARADGRRRRRRRGRCGSGRGRAPRRPRQLGVILSQILRGLADVAVRRRPTLKEISPKSMPGCLRPRCGTRTAWWSRLWAGN